jgi:hypothetical protein
MYAQISYLAINYVTKIILASLYGPVLSITLF